MKIAMLLTAISNLILGIALTINEPQTIQNVGSIVTLIAIINLMHYALAKD